MDINPDLTFLQEYKLNIIYRIPTFNKVLKIQTLSAKDHG